MMVCIVSVFLAFLLGTKYLLISASFSITLVYLMLVLKHDLESYSLYSSLLWDLPAYALVALTLLISVAMLLSSAAALSKPSQAVFFTPAVKALTFILLLAFCASSTLTFYFMFEASLIPTFIIILGFGNQPERTQAGIYMLMYTVFASLPLLLSLVAWASLFSVSDLQSLHLTMLPVSTMAKLWSMVVLLAFMVKLPLYMLHLWLPKAHVEAPVAGSMVLVAILLKLGGYGILRFAPLMKHALSKWNYLLVSWSLLGALIMGIVCISQTDIKVLIALSSVAHMALVVAGLLTLSSGGTNSAFLIMIAHGFCSSALFCIANMTYERTSSRNFMITKGMQTTLPSLTLAWFLISSSNMAAPPSLNLLGEMSAMITVVPFSTSAVLPLALGVFLSAAYSLLLYSNTQHGKPAWHAAGYPAASSRELLILTMHWVPLNVLVLSPLVLQPLL